MKKCMAYLIIVLSLSGCFKKGHLDLKVDTNGDGHHEVDLFLGQKKKTEIKQENTIKTEDLAEK